MPAKPPDRDSTAREVDRLLRQLPGADPMLRGDPEPEPVRGPVTRPAGPPPPPTPRGPTGVQRAGVWGVILLGALTGMALTQWPYAHACGFGLYGYLATMGVVMIAGGWGAVGAWRFRQPVAHVASLIVVFWGIVLAAEQVLPRVGYAAEAATWRCVEPAQPAAVVPALPVAPTPVEAAPPADSVPVTPPGAR